MMTEKHSVLNVEKADQHPRQHQQITVLIQAVLNIMLCYKIKRRNVATNAELLLPLVKWLTDNPDFSLKAVSFFFFDTA